jgi:hypothetical protein
LNRQYEEMVLLERKIAAETKLLANAYRKLPRDMQLAQLATMHEMALAFQVEQFAPEMAQPLPTALGRPLVIDPPGMPLRRLNILRMARLEADGGRWIAAEEFAKAMQKELRMTGSEN